MGGLQHAAPTSRGIGICARCRPLARTCILPAPRSISSRWPPRPLADQVWRASSEWASPAAPSRLIGRNCREPSLPERRKDRSVELRTSVFVSMARNGTVRAGSAPDDGCNGERRAATSTSPSRRLRSNPGRDTLDVPDHALLTDLAQTIGAGVAYLVQEPADGREVADDGT
jgi:hypothetical protein